MQSAIYGAGGSNVKPSSPTLVVVNAVVNMIPDAGMVTKGAGAGERLATQGLERAGGGAADDAAKLAKQALDDTAQAGGHAATGGAETAAKTEVGERVATEGAEPTVKTEERAAAASGGEHTQAAAHGDAPKPEATAPADDEVLVGIRGEDEVQPLSLDEVRGRRDDLTRDKAQLELAAGRKQEEIDRLRENVVARKAEMKNPRRLKAEDRIEELERELANQHVEIADVDRTLSEAQSDLHKLEGPKPPAPAPAPLAAARPPEPLGELAIPQQPLTLGGTRMQSWSDRVYIATSTEGYRPNVEKLLLKDPEGPLSKALLLDKPGGGRMIRAYSSPTKEVAEANRDLFVAGHFKSAKTGDRDVIVLTSAHRNMEFASDLETAGAHERMGDFVYVVQGIAVEPGTAWDLVRSTKLDAAVRARLEQELTEANKLWLAR